MDNPSVALNFAVDLGTAPMYTAAIGDALRTRNVTVMAPFTVGVDFLPGASRRVSSAIIAPIVWRNASDLGDTRTTGVVFAEFSLNDMLSIGMRGDDAAGGLDIVVQGFTMVDDGTGTDGKVPSRGGPRTIRVRGGVMDLNSSAHATLLGFLSRCADSHS